MARFSGHIADVDLHLLRVFKTIADCGGISAAEHVLNVGRSTISRQLSDLEMRLGLRLCERGPAGFRLTNEGRTVLKHARDLMVSPEDFRRHLREVHCEIAGDLVIALSDATVPNPYFDLPHAIDMFLNEAPLARVSVRIDAAKRDRKRFVEQALPRGARNPFTQSAAASTTSRSTTKWISCTSAAVTVSPIVKPRRYPSKAYVSTRLPPYPTSLVFWSR